MAEIKSIFRSYRERKCKIDNMEIEIDNLRLNGIEDTEMKIRELIIC